MILSRRLVLASAAGLAAFATRGAAAQPVSLSPLEMFTRIRCSPPGRRTWWWYSGHMLGHLAGEPARPMLSVMGVSRSEIVKRPDGSIGYSLLEAGYYGAPDRPGIADGDITNVLTGAPMRPEHYLSPQAIIFTPELTVRPDLPSLPPGLDYRGRITPPDIKDGRIWMAEELFVKAPGLKGGPPRVLNSLANFEADINDVTGAEGFVPATMQYTTLNSFRPWMNMGGRSGSIMMRLNAVKLPDWSKVPAELRQRIRSDHPDFAADV